MLTLGVAKVNTLLLSYKFLGKNFMLVDKVYCLTISYKQDNSCLYDGL